MESRTVSLRINQSEERNRTVSLRINQSEEGAELCHYEINQSEEEPCQRVRKRVKPARQEKQKKNRVNVLENVINRR